MDSGGCACVSVVSGSDVAGVAGVAGTGIVKPGVPRSLLVDWEDVPGVICSDLLTNGVPIGLRGGDFLGVPCALF